MKIVYRGTKQFPQESLKPLFDSVEQPSGDYPEWLENAMLYYGSVFTAWDGNHLIGMLCTMDDQVKTAQIQYRLAIPVYQRFGNGKALIQQVKVYYKDYLCRALISVPEQGAFYEHCNFSGDKEKVPMFPTSQMNQNILLL